MNDEGMAWFCMSEGSIGISVTWKDRKRNSICITPRVSIANTDDEMLQAGAKWCVDRSISFCIKGAKSTKVKSISVTSKNVERFLDFTEPYFVGAKRQQALLVREYFRYLYIKPGDNFDAYGRERLIKAVELSEKIFQTHTKKTSRNIELHERHMVLVKNWLSRPLTRIYHKVPPKETLLELYVNQRLNTIQIGQIYDVHHGIVRLWLIKNDIPRRRGKGARIKSEILT